VPRREFKVDRMQPGEEPAVVGALARAFYDDPHFGFFLPNHIHQSKGILAFMTGGVADARPFGEIWVAQTDDGKIASAAVWLPPEGYPRSKRRDFMTTVRAAPAFAHAGKRLAASFRLLNEVERSHHEITQPHMYLAILGSDPCFQRSGAGSAALQPVLDRCDEQGMLAYLETQKEENLAYYARHGFDVRKVLEVRGVPPMWTLQRTPR
jgi:hypothetical protein